MDNRYGETPGTGATTPSDTTQSTTSSTGAMSSTTQSAEDSTQRIKDAAGDATNRVKDAAGGAIGDMKAAAGSAIKDAKNMALHQVEDARAKAGDMGHSTASRFRELAGQVEQDLPWLSGAFTKSADGLESVTDSLTRGDLSQCMNGLSDFARRQPAIFLGASVALGFALSRIGKTALEEAAPALKPNEPAPQPFDGASTAYPTPTGV
jgi:hypothetical protein